MTATHLLAVLLSSISFVSAADARDQTQRERRVAASRVIDDLLAIPDVEVRIKALEGFLKDNTEGRRAVDAREALVRSWAELATRELSENRIGTAVEHFQKAVAELPEEVSDRLFEETVGRIPFVISRRGYRSESVTFARALEPRFSKEPMRLGTLGEFYLNVEAPGDAIRVLESAVQQRKDDVRLRRPLASAYRMSLRLDQSAKELEQIAALDQKDTRAYTELGNIARAKGEYDEALRYYRSQLQIDANNLAALKGIALTARARGHDSEEEEALSRIKELKDEAEIAGDIHLQTQMAFYYLAQGKFEKANFAIVKAIAIEPRYSWGRIAAAELDMVEGRIFEAEKHLLAALRTADFPTLRFALGRLYLSVEDFDGALEQFDRTFTLTKEGKFSARLGGVLELEAASLDELLSPERQASIFIAKSPASDQQFAMTEALARLEAKLKDTSKVKPTETQDASTPASAPTRRTRNVRTAAEQELDTLADAFVDVEGTRRVFRALYLAQKLSQSGVALPLALKYSDLVLELAETATAPDGSLPEFPNYDRDGRLRIVKGRALDARGWTLFEMRSNKEAVVALTEAVAAYGSLPEGKRVVWRLATVKETIGEQKEALDLYIAAYEPPSAGSTTDIKRSVIESLYRKVNGSVEGLEEKLGLPPAAVSATATGTGAATEPAAPVGEPAVEPKNDVKVGVELPVPSTSVVELVPRKSSMSTRLLRMPFRSNAALPPSPAKIQVETARPRRLSAPTDSPRPRRIERPE